jgi:hypothetical protein
MSVPDGTNTVEGVASSRNSRNMLKQIDCQEKF